MSRASRSGKARAVCNAMPQINRRGNVVGAATWRAVRAARERRAGAQMPGAGRAPCPSWQLSQVGNGRHELRLLSHRSV